MTGGVGKWIEHFREHRKGKGREKGKRARRAEEKGLLQQVTGAHFALLNI